MSRRASLGRTGWFTTSVVFVFALVFVFACICLSSILSMNKAGSRCRGELLLDGQDGGSSAKAPKAAPGPVLQP